MDQGNSGEALRRKRLERDNRECIDRLRTRLQRAEELLRQIRTERFDERIDAFLGERND